MNEEELATTIALCIWKRTEEGESPVSSKMGHGLMIEAGGFGMANAITLGTGTEKRPPSECWTTVWEPEMLVNATTRFGFFGPF